MRLLALAVALMVALAPARGRADPSAFGAVPRGHHGRGTGSWHPRPADAGDGRGGKRPAGRARRRDRMALDDQRRGRGICVRVEGGRDRRRERLSGAGREIDRRRLHADQPHASSRSFCARSTRHSTPPRTPAGPPASSNACSRRPDPGRAPLPATIRSRRMSAPNMHARCWRCGPGRVSASRCPTSQVPSRGTMTASFVPPISAWTSQPRQTLTPPPPSASAPPSPGGLAVPGSPTARVLALPSAAGSGGVVGRGLNAYRAMPTRLATSLFMRRG